MWSDGRRNCNIKTNLTEDDSVDCAIDKVYITCIINIDLTILDLQKLISEQSEKLSKRRLDMVDQDNSNVSRYITATRWAVEQEIESMDKELARLTNGIKEIKRLREEKIRYYDKYFVADKFEYLKLGIISRETELGKDIMEHNDIRRGTN